MSERYLPYDIQIDDRNLKIFLLLFVVWVLSIIISDRLHICVSVFMRSCLGDALKMSILCLWSIEKYCFFRHISVKKNYLIIVIFLPLCWLRLPSYLLWFLVVTFFVRSSFSQTTSRWSDTTLFDDHWHFFGVLSKSGLKIVYYYIRKDKRRTYNIMRTQYCVI